MSFFSKSKLVVVISAAVLAPAVAADSYQNFEFGAGIPYFLFDDNFNVEDDFGYRLFVAGRSNRFGLELSYDALSTEADSQTDFDLSQTYLNLLYHGDMLGSAEPYVTAGVGLADYDPEGVEGNESALTNFGAGVKFYMTNNLVLRPSVNYFLPVEEDDGYATFSLSLSWVIPGGPGKKKEPVVEQVIVEKKVADTDGDGVADSMDKCPSTPAGVSVDKVGCPLDSDGDGVFDYLDKCPSTAAKLKVDENGCPVVLTESVEIELKVNFDTNSDVVKSEFYPEIKKAADFLVQYANTKVVIEGHSDSRGAAAYNKTLSQKRADSVAKTLVSQFGIDASRVTAVGYGEERPIADNSTREGQMANRRVVAKVSTTVEKLEKK